MLALGGGGIYYYVSTRPQVPAAADSQRAADTEDGAVSAQAEVSPEEEAAAQEEAQIQAVLDSYTNLGLVQVSGYLNIRETPDPEGKIIGKLLGDSACEIVDRKETGTRSLPAAFPVISAASMCLPVTLPSRRPDLM